MKPKPESKPQKIKLNVKKPQKIKAALKTWALASDKVDTDPFNLDAAPPWVENALVEVVKVVLPGQRLTTVGEWDMEQIGEFQGRLQAFAKLYEGEIPMGAEVEAEFDKLQKFSAAQPQSTERTAKAKLLVKDLQARMKATNEAIPQMMAAALSSSHEDTIKFQNGLRRGMSLAPNDLTTAKTFQRHTRTFWTLAMMWPSFSKCRSVAAVHRILCQAAGEARIGSLKTFENRVAKKIGMKFGRSGRPPSRK